jgi:hypothetical protein
VDEILDDLARVRARLAACYENEHAGSTFGSAG